MAGRQRARAIGESAAIDELDLMGFPVSPPIVDTMEDDRAYASRASTSLAERWLEDAEELHQQMTMPEARAAATRRRGPQIELIGATEVAHALNDARARIGWHLHETGGDRAGTLAIYKWWDATLDRRTCSICNGQDGIVRPLGMSFGHRLPAHPRCRCFFGLVPLPITFDWESDTA